MISTDMQEKFNSLTEKDFMYIAESAAKDVLSEKVKNCILVNLSSFHCMIYDPVVIPREYKHLKVGYNNGTDIMIMIGLD